MSAITDTGFKTLQTISKARQFNSWMYQTIRPYLDGNILEIGSGTGNISHYVLEANFELTLSDYEDEYVEILRQHFHQLPNAKDFLSIDLVDENFGDTYAELKESFDTVFLLNVLEHIPDEKMAIGNCYSLLKTGGTLIVLVPAYPFLFSRMDKELKHYRRYTKKTLNRLFIQNGLTVTKSFYFNFLGISGWLWNKLFRKTEISHGKMDAFDKLVPFAKLLDKLLGKQIGLSVVSVCKKH